jgi:hypothetical protein
MATGDGPAGAAVARPDDGAPPPLLAAGFRGLRLRPAAAAGGDGGGKADGNQGVYCKVQGAGALRKYSDRD